MMGFCGRTGKFFYICIAKKEPGSVLSKMFFLFLGNKILPGLCCGGQFGVWRSPASAPALGAGGRRFESCYPDERTKTAQALPGRFFHLGGVKSASFCKPIQMKKPISTTGRNVGFRSFEQTPTQDHGVILLPRGIQNTCLSVAASAKAGVART